MDYPNGTTNERLRWDNDAEIRTNFFASVSLVSQRKCSTPENHADLKTGNI
jgi:hypothetical protein